MTKPEIVAYWKGIDHIKLNDPTNLFHKKVLLLVDSLKTAGIDTVGAYQETYHGSNFHGNKCYCGHVPWVAHVQWQHNGTVTQRKVLECCPYIQTTLKTSALLDFYVENETALKNDVVMPSISSGHKDKKGKVKLMHESTATSTEFGLLVFVRDRQHFARYKQFDVDNPANLFRSENANAPTVVWKKAMVKQLMGR